MSVDVTMSGHPLQYPHQHYQPYQHQIHQHHHHNLPLTGTATNNSTATSTLSTMCQNIGATGIAASSASTSSSSSTLTTTASTIAPFVVGTAADALADRLRFHNRCGSLVKLSPNSRTSERRRPLDEFNNGVVMTHRPLRDNELFEIRIDKLVDKWSGSIEVGVTTHNPAALHFPATMTNMRSGTIMMSGCGILTNGKGTRREYGEFNLDELREGDRVGMQRKANGNLHYYINGQDQGVAAQRVAATLWGVIDLYGMTIKVTIVDRDEREQQNLVTRRNNLMSMQSAAAAAAQAASAGGSGMLRCGVLGTGLGVGDEMMMMSSSTSTTAAAAAGAMMLGSGTTAVGGIGGMSLGMMLHSPDGDFVMGNDRLTFHSMCGSHASVTHSGRTALRPK